MAPSHLQNNAMKFILDFHKKMLTHKIIMSYRGEFSQDIIKNVLMMTERNMENIGEEAGVKRKVFNIMVECLQNICKHVEYKNAEYKTAIFMMGFDNKNYFITTGNYLTNENTGPLKTKLDLVNSLDKDGLKLLFKDIVTSGKLSDKGGAGLGLIDISRKSGNKLIYTLQSIDSEKSFYSLLVKIPRLPVVKNAEELSE
jgi:hypothetical protein